MKLATRINSLLPEVNGSILKALEKISNIEGIDAVDLNYPEHFDGVSLKELKLKLEELNLEVNGIALRFRGEFINGDLGNLDDNISDKAVELSKRASDICKELNGKVVTIWLGHDGFDYPFQLNYSKVWNKVKNNIQEIADYNKTIKFSIEYKPYEERAFALIDSVGSTLLMTKEINRKNVGVTLDYCHMLMKKENPAFGLSLVNEQSELFGVHINDGYSFQDNGLMLGTSSFFQTIEFLYYLKKHNENATVYFDTFPIREDAVKEIEQNIKMFELITKKIDKIGLKAISDQIEKNDGIAAHNLMIELIKN